MKTTAERLRGLGYGSYRDYLRSSHWRRLRKRLDQPKVCATCDSADRLHLHHRTYERLGAEEPSDLVWLCADCHDLLHQIERAGLSTLDPESAFDRANADPFIPPNPVPNDAFWALPRADRKRITRHLLEKRARARELDEPAVLDLRPNEVRRYGGYLARQSAKTRTRVLATETGSALRPVAQA